VNGDAGVNGGRQPSFLALAADYDGTLATDGGVSERVLAALRRLRSSGRRLVLVTGRQLEHLLASFPDVSVFDRVVAENGALVHIPATGEETTLGPAPPGQLVAALEARGVTPLSVGRVIVASSEPHERAVLEVIDALGLEHRVIRNKGAVMVLPAGVDKAAGLVEALRSLCLSPRDAVGIGDAENDEEFLASCGCSVAVANALPELKSAVDWVTRGEEGDGVVELVERLLGDGEG
jgi:hydroxymethylpyrimidine pyrophosphatase-like HAD family hydrolase